jgi:hypothetical protein
LYSIGFVVDPEEEEEVAVRVGKRWRETEESSRSIFSRGSGTGLRVSLSSTHQFFEAIETVE